MTYDRHEHLTVWVLRFEQHPGLVVRVRKPTWSGLRAVARYTLVLDGRPTGAQRLRAYHDLFGALAGALVSWTLTSSGRPVPATRRGVMSQDFELLTEIAMAWYQRVVLAKPGPAPVDEPAGDAELEAGIPMEPLTDAPDPVAVAS